MTERKMPGISNAQAEEKLKREGKNVFENGKKAGPIRIFLSQYKDLITIVLIIGALISIFLGEVADSAVIMIIVIMNGVLGFVQEYRTEKSLEALKKLSAPVCTVIRDGERRNIAAENVVTDDVILLSAGDRVPADCKIISQGEISTNESILTGESAAVRKNRGDMLYMGTGLNTGKCTAVVTATGMNTKMGAVAGMLNVESGETPLKKRLNKIGKMLVGISLGVCVIIAFAGIYYGQPLAEVFFSGVSLAVAAIPEGLPAAVTLCLAIGVRKMLKRNALVRKLPAVETLGCTTVICSDKTGTLTQNKMTAVKFYAGGTESSSFKEAGRCFDMLHMVGLLCLDEDTCERMGDPTERAIFTAARLRGASINGYVRKGEIPFSSERKAMSVIYERGGEYFMAVKGACDRILKKCDRVLTEQGEQLLTPKMREQIEDQVCAMAERALRVLGFAYRKSNEKINNTEEEENALVFVGLMGMIDPPRPEAEESIKSCYRAGIRPVMITGDHSATATEVARQIGIKIKKNGIMLGEEIEKLSDRELEKRACDVSVYARVSPRHKLRIVKALKNMGNIVAMTGDGVNDAPALKEADIGVAMGKSGTDVAKEASTVVLTDDNFATIVAAVEEGRTIYNNIRKFIRYLLSCNLGEILLMGCAAFMGLPVPLLPMQILWVNLVTDGLPALALGMCKGEKDTMQKPPRNPKESIFAGGLGGSIAFSGLIIGGASLIAFVLGYRVHGDLMVARTACFAVLIIAELFFAVECRREGEERVPFFGNKYLIFAVIFSFFLMLAVIFVPQISRLFSVTVPKGKVWVEILLLSLTEPMLRKILYPGKGNKKSKRSIPLSEK